MGKGGQGLIVVILTWKELEQDLTFMFQRLRIETGTSQQRRQGKCPLIFTTEETRQVSFDFHKLFPLGNWSENISCYTSRVKHCKSGLHPLKRGQQWRSLYLDCMEIMEN